VPQASASIITQAERLRPVDREQQGVGAAQELVLLAPAHLADELDERPGLVEQGLDGPLVIIALLRVDFRRDLELPARPPGDLDGPVQALLGGDPAEEGQVVARPVTEGVQVARQAVVDRAPPVGPRDRPALVVRDGDERHPGVLVEQRPQVGDVQPPVQGRDAGAGLQA
jgi:hypothetical protein